MEAYHEVEAEDEEETQDESINRDDLPSTADLSEKEEANKSFFDESQQQSATNIAGGNRSTNPYYFLEMTEVI